LGSVGRIGARPSGFRWDACWFWCEGWLCARFARLRRNPSGFRTWFNGLGVHNPVISATSTARCITLFEITHANEPSELGLMERDSPTFALVLDPSAGQRPGTVF